MKKPTRKRVKKRKITTDDLLQMRFVESLSISPDEEQIALSVKTVVKEKKKYNSHIYLVNSDGSNLRQFTFGDVSDSAPVFSPDGETIAFLSKRGEKKGIYIIPHDGGEAKLLVEKDGGFSELSFSPDSKKLLCIFRAADEVPKDEKGKKEQPVYRHITRLLYKMDNMGFYPKAEGQVWTFDIATGKGTQITRGGRTKSSPRFSPNGRQIVYETNIQKNHDIDLDLTDIFIIAAKGGKARRLNTPKGPAYLPKFSPDGKFVAYLGHDNPDDAWGVTNFHVWKVPVHGGGAVDLTKKLDRMTLDMTISDTSEVGESALLEWSADGKWLYFQVSDSGSTHLYCVSASGRKLEKVIGGKIHVAAATLSGRRNKLATLIANHTTPADLHLVNPASSAKPVRLTHFNDKLEKEIAISRPEEIIFRGYDNNPIHGWILKPHGFSSGRKYPSILQIHGGPRVQYGATFFHEMQWLAAQGYVVYYANPRGGQGYGEQHADAITGRWGTVDFDDCMAFADFMEKKPYVDRSKMGVTGGSYGGYMTNWIIAHTNRFAAAVTQRSVVNLESMFGSSDIGFHLPRELRSTPYKDLDAYRRQSPLTYATSIRTPLLIIHSEQDLRCPIEQAEQLFVTLKMLGRKVEFVRFPGEPHGLSRCGRPDRRVARLEWIRKWFDRYLKGQK